jgi:hypothetical protein
VSEPGIDKTRMMVDAIQDSLQVHPVLRAGSGLASQPPSSQLAQRDAFVIHLPMRELTATGLASDAPRPARKAPPSLARCQRPRTEGAVQGRRRRRAQRARPGRRRRCVALGRTCGGEAGAGSWGPASNSHVLRDLRGVPHQERSPTDFAGDPVCQEAPHPAFAQARLLSFVGLALAT